MLPLIIEMQACISEGVEGLNAGVLLGVSSTLVVRMHTRVNREKNASLGASNLQFFSAIYPNAHSIRCSLVGDQ